MTVAPAAGTVPALIAYAVGAGLVECAADLDLIKHLAAEVALSEFERGRAYERAAIRQASNAISAALDWHTEASRLSGAERARAYRAAMLS